MTTLQEAVLADLLAASEHLLERGLATIGAVGSGGTIGPASFRAGEATRLAGLVRRALDELANVPSRERETLELSHVPRRAKPSHRGQDYARWGTSAVPVVWLTRRPALEAPRGPLQWLLALLDAACVAVDRHLSLYSDALDEAVRFRGGSEWGDRDVEQLEDDQRRLRTSRSALREARQRVTSASSFALVPNERRPHPFPRTPAFEAIARLAARTSSPSATARALASDLFRQRGEGVDLAYLYQRWCGLKLVEALQRRGYGPSCDPIPPLLLSGAIEFHGPTPAVTLVSEARLVAGKPPIEGLFVHHGEATPDLVLIAHSRSGRCVHVLDPTLRTQDEARWSKARYLDILKVEGVRHIAGVGVQPSVDTSWAAAPMRHTNCLPSDWRGLHGTVPMLPQAWDARPLDAWLEFVLDRA